MKRVLALIVTLCLVLPLTVAAQDASTPLIANVEAAKLDIVVPTVLPVDIDARGNVTVATDAKITNNSIGMVTCTSLQVEPISGWTIAPVSKDMAQEAVGSKQFNMALNSTEVETNGSVNIDAWSSINGKATSPVTYAVGVAPQLKTENLNMASIVFTFDWHKVISVAPEDVAPVAITIRTSPARTSYIAGDKFDPTGLDANVKYNDGTTSIKTSTQLAFTDGESMTSNQSAVTVSYKQNNSAVLCKQPVQVEDQPVDIANSMRFYGKIKDNGNKLEPVFTIKSSDGSKTLPASAMTQRVNATEATYELFVDKSQLAALGGTCTISAKKYHCLSTEITNVPTVFSADVQLGYITFVNGDASGDGFSIGFNDSGIVNAAMMKDPAPGNVSAGDLNCDGVVTVEDQDIIKANMMRMYATYKFSDIGKGMQEFASNSTIAWQHQSYKNYIVSATLTKGKEPANKADIKDVSSESNTRTVTYWTSSNTVDSSKYDLTVSTESGVSDALSPYAFNSMDSLERITADYGPKTIGFRSFANNKKLQEVSLAEGTESIGDRAFEWCPLLSKVSLPNGLKTIGEFAFTGCKALTEITIPSSVTAIASNAFAECTALTTIHYSGLAAGAPWGAPTATVSK